VLSDSIEARLDKLEHFYGQYPNISRTNYALSASLLGLPTDRYGKLDFSPLQNREETSKRILAEYDYRSPGMTRLFVCEDVHWIDPSSLAIIHQRMDNFADLPILFVLTFRPDFEIPSNWLGRPGVTMMNLSRLGRDDSNAIVTQVAGGKRLPDDVTRRILDHSEGVPLFIEEITRSVIESGLFRVEGDAYVTDGPLPEISVPPTLQASLLARLDRLSPIKEIAQIGAAVGRQFPRALVAAVARKAEPELDAALDQLIAADLIFGRGVGQDTVYEFKHALIRDIAYDTLLRSQRQALHARIAEVLKSRFPDRVAAQPELLAQHLADAGQTKESVEFWRQAADRSVRAGATTEALRQLDRGLSLIATLPTSPDRDRLELSLLQPRLYVEWAVKGPSPESLRFSEESYALAMKIGDEKAALEPAAVWVLVGTAYRGDVAGVLEQGKHFRERARRAGLTEPPGIAIVESYARAFVGRLGEEGFAACSRTIDLIDRANDAEGRKDAFDWDRSHALPLVLQLSHELFHCHAQQVNALNMAIETCLSLAWPTVAIQMDNMRATFLYTIDKAECSKCVRHGRNAIASLGIPAGPWLVLELLHASETQSGEALEHVDELCTKVTPLDGPFARVVAADMHLAFGDKSRAVAHLEEALKGGPYGSLQWLRAEVLRRLADLAVEEDRVQGERLYREAIDAARQTDMLLFELRAATHLARLLQKQERASEARRLLQPIYDRFTEGFETRDLIEARAALAV
jgi:hypothetical protein